MSILVGTDFTIGAAGAADVAADIARARGDLLVLAHFAGRGATAGTQARMHSEITRLEAVCPVKGWFEEEPASGERMAALARDMQASLLVVGAGEGLRARALGSLASAAMEHLPDLPVLAVRAAAELRRPSARLVALFALDETDLGVFESLAVLRGADRADFDAIHYTALPREHPADHEARLVVERQLRERLHDHVPGDMQPKTVIIRGVRDGAGIEDDIAALVRERGAALVVCGSHHRHGVRRLLEGSVAERVLARAPVSVLISKTSEPSNREATA